MGPGPGRRRSGSVDPESPLSESRPPGHADRDLRRRDRPETATRTGPSTLAEPGVRRQGSESPVRRRRIGSANRTPEVAAEFPSARPCAFLFLLTAETAKHWLRGSGANAKGNFGLLGAAVVQSTIHWNVQQSCPPVVTMCESPTRNVTLVTCAEWPKARLASPCQRNGNNPQPLAAKSFRSDTTGTHRLPCATACRARVVFAACVRASPRDAQRLAARRTHRPPPADCARGSAPPR
jgi:hypothetical protein